MNKIVIMCSKKNNKKKINFAEKVRRDNELNMYGKLLSLRPSKVHKSKKEYKRKWKVEDYE